MKQTDVVIIGAGAAGLMCAIEAGKRGRRVLLLDHASKPGKKILIAGGGKCNFTNYHISAENYLSANPHFCKSALSRFSQWDFIAMMQDAGIPFHERDHGQLFCDHSARDIVNMLLEHCRHAGVKILCNTSIDAVDKKDGFIIHSNSETFQCQSLVVASGGLSIPKMGATAFGLKLAEQFGLDVVAPRAGLVPFTLHEQDKRFYQPLSGISLPATLRSHCGQAFTEALLFTHRGLSGPAALQISSYWRPGETIGIDLLPGQSLADSLAQENSRQLLHNFLGRWLPKRLIQARLDHTGIKDKPLAQLCTEEINRIADCFQHWQLQPNGTEGYRTAEVTIGGVDTKHISSKTMQANTVAGLYFIGEVLDVTGHLGGYNLQWAWSSGYAAGQAV